MGDVSVLDRLKRIEFGRSTHQLTAKQKGRPTAAAKDSGESKAYVVHLNVEIKRFHAGNKELRTRACQEIGHLCYHGGDAIQAYLLTDNRLIQTMLAVISNKSENLALRLQTIQTLHVIINVSRLNVLEEVILKAKTDVVLATTIDDDNEEMRMWVAHALWCLSALCLPKISEALRTSTFQVELRAVANDNWTHWACNDAEELMKLLEMNYARDDVCASVTSARKQAKIEAGYISPTESGTSTPTGIGSRSGSFSFGHLFPISGGGGGGGGESSRRSSMLWSAFDLAKRGRRGSSDG